MVYNLYVFTSQKQMRMLLFQLYMVYNLYVFISQWLQCFPYRQLYMVYKLYVFISVILFLCGKSWLYMVYNLYVFTSVCLSVPIFISCICYTIYMYLHHSPDIAMYPVVVYGIQFICIYILCFISVCK